MRQKSTHWFFSVHGLHPQFPVSLRQSLERDGRVSMETVTNAIKKIQLEKALLDYD